MPADAYKIEVHPNAEREFQRLPETAREFVRENVRTWAEIDRPRDDPRYDRSDDIPPKPKVITFPNQGRDTYGISGVAVEIDCPKSRITITGLILEQS